MSTIIVKAQAQSLDSSIHDFFFKYQELGCGFLELCSLSVRLNHVLGLLMSTFHCITRKTKIFRESGTAADKERPGRPVAIGVLENLHTSIRVRSAQLQLSTGSNNRLELHS